MSLFRAKIVSWQSVSADGALKKDLCFCGILPTLQRLEFVIHVRSYDLNGAELTQFDLKRIHDVTNTSYVELQCQINSLIF